MEKKRFCFLTKHVGLSVLDSPLPFKLKRKSNNTQYSLLIFHVKLLKFHTYTQIIILEYFCKTRSSTFITHA